MAVSLRGGKMNTKLALAAILIVGIFLIGCQQDYATGGYQSYNQPGQQNQYVGGGCGVAPSSDYKEPFRSEDSSL